MGVTVLYASGDYGVAGSGGTCINPKTGNYSTGPDGVEFNPGVLPNSFPACLDVDTNGWGQ